MDDPALHPAAHRRALAGLARLNAVNNALGGKLQILTPAKVNEIFHSDWTVHDRRLPAALDWAPRYDLATGFADTIAWYRRAKWL